MNSNYKILVVDDSPEILDITVLALKREKYTVFSAVTGADCINVLKKEKPNILLLDVILPDANGIELAKKIKEDPEYSNLFIILLSGHRTSADFVAEGIEGGADGYIIKPVEKRELLARVASACRIINVEEKLRLQNEELQKINAEKDKFFSIIAHDLKTPFNSIIGLSEILIERINKNDTNEIGKFADLILQSSNRAMDLLTNLIVWSQSQTGRLKFNPENFNLSQFVDETTVLFIVIADQKSIKINQLIDPTIFVHADKAMFGTILRNLISNALKFTFTGGEINVSATKNNDEISILVSDNGVGIPKISLDRLFQIDSDYSTSGTQNEKGTGLGLLLCKEFVEKHGGKIWVESEVGSGSKFYFTLQLK